MGAHSVLSPVCDVMDQGVRCISPLLSVAGARAALLTRPLSSMNSTHSWHCIQVLFSPFWSCVNVRLRGDESSGRQMSAVGCGSPGKKNQATKMAVSIK